MRKARYPVCVCGGGTDTDEHRAVANSHLDDLSHRWRCRAYLEGKKEDFFVLVLPLFLQENIIILDHFVTSVCAVMLFTNYAALSLLY